MGSTPKYQIEIEVTPEHIDDLDHVNNVVYLQWIQDVAKAHWSKLAPADALEQYIWVVRRHEIDYLGPALLGDDLTATTWVEVFEGVKSIRWVEISRNSKVLVRSKTTWVMLHSKTGKPARVSKEMAKRFLEVSKN